MRKFIGFCLVLAAFASGLFWLSHRGYVKVEIDLSPTSGRVETSSSTFEPVLPDDLPEEPVAIETTSVAVAGGIDLPALPGEAAPPIVIPETIDVPVAAGDAEAVTPAVYKGWPSAPADTTPAAPVATRWMPYCEDCNDSPRMPYVRDGDDLQTRTEEEIGSMLQTLAMKRLIELAQAHGVQLDEEESEDAQSQPADRQKGKTLPNLPPSELVPLGTMPNCEEDGNYHRHYPGCPYAGHCPYSGGHYHAVQPYVEPSRPYQSPIAPAGSKESTEEPPTTTPATKGPIRHETMKPRGNPFPERAAIDTMEFRKTDRRIDEYGPGPF